MNTQTQHPVTHVTMTTGGVTSAFIVSFDGFLWKCEGIGYARKFDTMMIQLGSAHLVAMDDARKRTGKAE